MSTKLLARAGVLTALALGASACGSGGGGGQSQQPAQTPQSQATPVAEVSNLSGERTGVTLDEKFTGALEELEVTPGPVGDAKISEAGVATFPITGGNLLRAGQHEPVCAR